MKKLALILVVLVMLVGCGPAVETTWDELTALDRNYANALTMAFNSNENQLQGSIWVLHQLLKEFRQIVPSRDIPEHIWDACEGRFALPIDAFNLILDESVMQLQPGSNKAEAQSKFDQATFAFETCREWFTQELGK